jgi:hypothetical protein
MSRSGLEIDRDTGNIIREGCGSCVVKVWHKPDPHTGKGGHFTEPKEAEEPLKETESKA